MAARVGGPVCILLVDDEKAAVELSALTLAQENVEILSTTNSLEALRLVRERHPHIVLMDLNMPEMSGLEALPQILEIDSRVEVVLLTADESRESAILAIRKGAIDYWTKPIEPEVLRERVDALIADIQQQQLFDEEALDNLEFDGIIGRSPLVLNMLTRIRRVAPHSRNTLIVGESGTGKELVAQALHRLGPVGERPLVACNCAAIVEPLFESEMFGHVKGAFTGANANKEGLFEMADGGSLFLDEINGLPLASQAKLLRVIQNQEIQRVGSGAVKKIDVRVIAATNRDLRESVHQKQFREDLYYRLAMVEIPLPALRERKEDLPLLEAHFLKKFSESYGRSIRGLSQRAEVALANHTWPGNIRELENVLGHGCMVAEGACVDLNDLPQYLQHLDKQPVRASGETVSMGELVSMEEMQRRHVQQVLAYVGGNKIQAAHILGISRATLYRFLSSNSKNRPTISPVFEEYKRDKSA